MIAFWRKVVEFISQHWFEYKWHCQKIGSFSQHQDYNHKRTLLILLWRQSTPYGNNLQFVITFRTTILASFDKSILKASFPPDYARTRFYIVLTEKIIWGLIFIPSSVTHCLPKYMVVAMPWSPVALSWFQVPQLLNDLWLLLSISLNWKQNCYWVPLWSLFQNGETWIYSEAIFLSQTIPWIFNMREGLM